MVGNFSGFNVAKTRAEHSIFSWGNVRVNLTEAPTGKITVVNPQKSLTGDTIYLSYFQNEISSVRVPVPAPAGVNKFLTDALSGCMFFVDTITGSNDLIVYHSNAKQHSPPGNLSGTHPMTELPAAAALLTALHTRAQGDYPGLVLNTAGSVNKPVYNLQAQNEVNRKRGQNRTNVEFLGGTIVVGFWTGAAWEFYWQTYGDTEYDRPSNAPLRLVKGTHHGGADIRVMGRGQIY
jgi:hypothetical protein